MQARKLAGYPQRSCCYSCTAGDLTIFTDKEPVSHQVAALQVASACTRRSCAQWSSARVRTLGLPWLACA